MDKKYDVICIGAGPGGYSAAIRLARAGKSVAVIDRSAASLGGTCLNEGCIPVKSMLKISKMRAELKKNGERYGLGVEVKSPDLKRITAYSKEMSAALKKGISYLFKKNKVDFIEGKASLISVDEVSVKQGVDSSTVLKADNIILAVGSKPAEVNGLELDGVKIISSREAVSLEVLPKRIIIAGAGAIGIEFACIFNNLGSEVILVEIKDCILPTEDKDIALGLTQLLKKDGIKIYTKSRLEIKQKEENLVRVKIVGVDKEEEVGTDLVLVAVGRQPAINIGELKKVGIEIEGGGVKVDENMKTTASHIYAVGDITPYPMFAHAAYKESEIAALSILGKPSAKINSWEIPAVVYSNIETARVGLTEARASAAGSDYKVSKHFFRSNGRAVLSNYPEGFIKIIADVKSRKLIGVSILGHEASELIHQFALCMSHNIPVDEVGKAIYAHPTFSEIVCEASTAVFGQALHG